MSGSFHTAHQLVTVLLLMNDRTNRVLSEKDILEMILEGYDNKLRPKTTVNGTAGPAVVKVNFLIRSISKVDDLNMEYSTQLTFREEWNDDRLAYDDGNVHEYLVLPDPDKIWKPDLFFQNEKSAHLHNLLMPSYPLHWVVPWISGSFPWTVKFAKYEWQAFMLICVSWVSFWLDPEATPARVSLGVTTLLTMATTQSGINAQLPPVSYTKAIDVWTGVCITFIFGALLEFAFVNYWIQKDKARQRKQDANNKKNDNVRRDEEKAHHTLYQSHENVLATCACHSSVPNLLQQEGSNLGPKKMSQTSLDHFGQHRMHSINRRGQRSPVYRTVSSGTRLDTETDLLDVEQNPSVYAMKPLLSQRSRSRLNPGGDSRSHPSSFLVQTCAECNDMGISVDDGMDYQNYEMDLHQEVDETAEEGDAGNLRMRRVGRNRSLRSNKGSVRCPLHDPPATVLSNPSISAADLEAGNAYSHRQTMANHVGGGPLGSRKDFHGNSSSDVHKPRIAQPKQRTCFGGRIRIPSKNAKRIDFFSRLIFPGVFLTFNLLYWNLYLGNVMEWPEVI